MYFSFLWDLDWQALTIYALNTVSLKETACDYVAYSWNKYKKPKKARYPGACRFDASLFLFVHRPTQIDDALLNSGTKRTMQ